jgi:hypothetical protein
MINVLESTLEWTLGEVIVNAGIGSHAPSFSVDLVFLWIKFFCGFGIRQLPGFTNKESRGSRED